WQIIRLGGVEHDAADVEEQGDFELIGDAVSHHQAFGRFVGCMVLAELRGLDAVGLDENTATPSEECVENEDQYRMRHHGPEHFVACHAANSFGISESRTTV